MIQNLLSKINLRVFIHIIDLRYLIVARKCLSKLNTLPNLLSPKEIGYICNFIIDSILTKIFYINFIPIKIKQIRDAAHMPVLR